MELRPCRTRRINLTGEVFRCKFTHQYTRSWGDATIASDGRYWHLADILSLMTRSEHRWLGLLPLSDCGHGLVRCFLLICGVWMRRREFIKVIAGTAAAWPLTSHAQQPSMPVVGFLSVRSAADAVDDVAAFRSGLRESGYVDGRNVRINFAWGEGIYDRLQAQADDFVRACL